MSESDDTPVHDVHTSGRKQETLLDGINPGVDILWQLLTSAAANQYGNGQQQFLDAL